MAQAQSTQATNQENEVSKIFIIISEVNWVHG